jgi:Trypsin
VVNVAAVYPHERYNANDQYINDIGLVRTLHAMSLELFNFKVKLAPTAAYYETGTVAVLTGWGRNEVYI